MLHKFESTEEQTRELFEITRSKQLLVHNAETGLINYGEGPIILIYADVIQTLSRILSQFTDAYLSKAILFRAGFEHGCNVFKKFKKSLEREGKEVSPVEAMSFSISSLSVSGWGKTIVEYEDEIGTVRFIYPHGTAIANSPGGMNSGDTVCSFVAGDHSGWSSSVLGTEVHLIETKCYAKGDGACVFEYKNQTKRKVRF
jgi:predicted hydrocarbon binding protein